MRATAIDRKLKTGKALFRLGDKTTGLFEIITGCVRLIRVDRSGHEIILYVAGPGDTLAEASLFSPAYHCDAVASTDVVVRIYRKAAMLAAFDKDPKATQAFAATLAHQVMNLRTRIEQRNIRSRASASAIFCASMPAPTAASIDLPGTLTELAAELGLTHERSTARWPLLERAGEIKRGTGKITLRRRAKAASQTLPGHAARRSRAAGRPARCRSGSPAAG